MTFLRISLIQLPVSGYLEHAAGRLLALGGDESYRTRVMLASLPLAAGLRAALVRVAGRPLLLPRFDTLRRWAMAAPCPEVPQPLPESERLVLLRSALAAQGWFEERSLWGLAGELASLADELSAAAVVLPEDVEDLRGQLERSYALRDSVPLAFEARLVHEMWRVLAGVGRPDAESAYRMRLAALAQETEGPLFVLLDALPEECLSVAEQAFIERYAEHDAVLVCVPCPREQDDASLNSPLGRLLHAAWPMERGERKEKEAGKEAVAPLPSVRERARALRDQWAESPLAGRLQLVPVSGREAEAEAVVAQVFAWLQEGVRRIALVAEDRLTARRVRALLERQKVLVVDETGWKLSTTRAAASLDALFECVAGGASRGAHHLDVLDLLKSPHVFSGLSAGSPSAAVLLIEKVIRQRGIRAGFEAIRDALMRTGQSIARERVRAGQALTEAGSDSFAGSAGSAKSEFSVHPEQGASEYAECTESAEPSEQGAAMVVGQAFSLLERVEAAVLVLRGGTASLSGWLSRLRRALESLEAMEALAADAAGAQILELIEQRSRELEPLGQGAPRFGFAVFREWLDREFEATGFRDRRIASSVVLLPRQDTRLRDFEAAIIMGADATRMAPAASGAFFNQAVRRDLGLPGRAEARAALRRDLELLLQTVPHVRVTWQSMQEGEAHLLAPEFEVLSALHQAAWGDDLRRAPLPRWPLRPPDPLTLPEVPQRACPSVLPSVLPHLLPTRISVSALASLVACPYQFFVRHVLGLDTFEDVRETLEKSDYGALVHRSLERFHRQVPVLSELPHEEARSRLDEVVCATFAEAEKEDYLAAGWRMRWQKQLDAYLEWQRASEAEGWRWQAAEEKGACQLPLPEGGSIELYGRIDRIDRSDAGGVRLIDYKTREAKSLREALPEDVQLSAYALLHAGSGGVLAAPSASQALYLALADEAPVVVPCPGDLPEIAAAQGARLIAAMSALRQGHGLPAHGVDAVCRHCEARGLCRRDHVAGN